MPAIRRATVFGGSGFIGRYLVQRLARSGTVVTVIGRHVSDAGFLQPMGDVGQIVRRHAALDDEAALRLVTADADAVINLVGILAEGGRQRFDAIQHVGAERIARIAAESGVAHFVHVSAIGADPQARSRYARSKGLGEIAVRARFPGAVILRPSIVFGPEDQFFNRFGEMARRVQIVPLIGGGHTRFQPVHVGDVADAAMAALTLPDARGRTYELGGPQTYTFRELMRMMLAEIHRPAVELLTIPFALASLMAALTGWLPGAPLTSDQVLLLRQDNVVTPGAATLDDLGIRPTAAELILPTYLGRLRPGGWFATRHIEP